VTGDRHLRGKRGANRGQFAQGERQLQHLGCADRFQVGNGCLQRHDALGHRTAFQEQEGPLQGCTGAIDALEDLERLRAHSAAEQP